VAFEGGDDSGAHPAERPAPAAGRAGPVLAPPPAVAYRRPAVCPAPAGGGVPLSAGGARHAPAAQAAGGGHGPPAQQGDQPIAASQSMYTYLVDSDGNINFPVLGKIHVAGLSKQELCDELQSKLSKYIENPLVNVQITNYRITVMGEVNRPGTFTIKNDRISILDAFGYVGDLAITANRKNILLIRDNDGQKEFVRMDITDPSLFTSPYFYLRQNDVIYVEPNLAKQRNSRFSQSKQYNITVFSSIISAISVISSMVITIINIKK